MKIYTVDVYYVTKKTGKPGVKRFFNISARNNGSAFNIAGKRLPKDKKWTGGTTWLQSYKYMLYKAEAEFRRDAINHEVSGRE